MGAEPSLTIAVISQKGGVGKTTAALNLGAAFHLKGRDTIILDLDWQSSAMDWSTARPAGSPLDGLAVAKADRVLKIERFRELSRGHDVVIMDGPPRLSDVTRAAALVADVALIPLRPGGFDWWATEETLNLLDAADELRAELKRQPIRRLFVLNAIDQRSTLAVEALHALKDLGQVGPSIANRIAFPRAATQGDSVLTMEPDGAAAREIWNLWAAVVAVKNGDNHV